MKAIILAGGQATRLLPITAEVPKCLLPVGRKTILGWQIKALQDCGITEVILITGKHAEQVRSYMHDAHPDIRTVFIHNERFESTRPAHGLFLAQRYLRDDITIYLNGDALFETRVLSQVLNDPHESTTAIEHGTWDEEQVNVILEDSRVVEIGKHIQEHGSHGEFIGVTKFGPSFGALLANVLEHTPTSLRDEMFAVDAICAAINTGGYMFATDITGMTALEIDTVEDYKRAEMVWND